MLTIGVFHHVPLMMALVLLLAWFWDTLLGDLPEAVNPVAWLEKLLWPLGCWLRIKPAKWAFWGGALVWLAMAALLWFAVLALQTRVLKLGPWFSIPLLVLLLKPMLGWRTLRDHVTDVELALAQGEGPAREQLSHLVNRDISELGEDALRQTAIETLASRLNRLVIGPLFWLTVAGLPGVVVYRFANTIAAMWGRRGIWESAGKWAAHADDVLSWLPARITALALYPTWNTPAWRALRRQARRTPSPNSGWAMGAMALRLRVRLAESGVYVLNETGASPSPRNMAAALRYAGGAAWACMVLAVLIMLARAL